MSKPERRPNPQLVEHDPFASSPGVHTAMKWAQSFLFVLTAVVVAAAAGLGFVYVNPLMIIGALIALTVGLLILANPYFGFLIYLVIFIVRPGEQWPALDAFRVERLVGAFTLAIMAFGIFREKGSLVVDGSRQTLGLFAIVIAMVLSVPGSYWVTGSADRVVDMLKIVALYLMIVHLVDSRSRLRVFLVLYLVLLAYIGFTALYDFHTGTYLYAQGIDRIIGRTSASDNPNALGTTTAALLPVLFGLIRVSRSTWIRFFLLVWVVASIYIILLTGSRASFLALMAGVGHLIWQSRHRTAWILIAIAIAPVVFVSMPEQYRERYTTIADAASGSFDGSTEGRFDAWVAGAHMLSDRPFFGVGAGCFGVAHAYTYSTGFTRSWTEAHSLYVQVPAEIGLVGAVAFAFFLFSMIRINRTAAGEIRARGPDWDLESVLLNGLWSGIMVLLIAGVFGHSLFRTTWYEYAAIGLAVYRIHRSLPMPSPGTGSGSGSEA